MPPFNSDVNDEFHYKEDSSIKTDRMRLSSITAAFALLFAGSYALEKPLDIEVQKAVECSRKTKTGMYNAVRK